MFNGRGHLSFRPGRRVARGSVAQLFGPMPASSLDRDTGRVENIHVDTVTGRAAGNDDL